MVLLGMKFNTLAVALVPLLMGLGVDYSVHLFHNYRAEIQKGKKVNEAIVSSIKDVGTALLLATITTCISFLSFLTSTVPPLRDFGILCAIGIIYTFIVAITLQSSLRYLLDRNKKIVIKPSRKISIGNIMEKISNVLCNNPKKILAIIFIITIIMISGVLNIKTSFSMEEFLPKESSSIRIMEKLYEKFPFFSQQQEYIFIEGNIATVEALEGIKKTHMKIRDDEFVALNPDGSPKVNSIYSIMLEALERNKTLYKKFNGLKSDKDIAEFYDYLYENYNAKNVLYKKDGKYNATVIRIYTNLGFSPDSKKLEKMYRELNEDLTSYGNAKAIVTGKSTLLYTITKSLTESQIISTIICLILAAIVIIIAYKSLLGIIAIAPVSISAIWILGTMYFIGYSLNVMTVMVTSLTIGLGITYAIHALERFRLLKNKGIIAISETIKHTGGAIMIAALTTIAGFIMLIFSPMPPERQFGIVTATTIFYSFLTTILILPPLLIIFFKKLK